MKIIEKTGDASVDQNGGGRGKCYVCGSEEHLVHKYCGLCRSLKHRTRDCEERGAEKGAIRAKIYVPANVEVRRVETTTTGAARGDGKEKWDPDSCASSHVSHTQAGGAAYKKAPAGTTVEVAGGTHLSVNGFGTVEVDLDQPCTTTKPVKIIYVSYNPGRSRNLQSARKTVEQ